jgi:hypothetical protein
MLPAHNVAITQLYYYHSLHALDRARLHFCKGGNFHRVMKAGLRISIKDSHRKKNLKVLLFRPPFPCRQFLVRMNGQAWPARGGPVSLPRLVTALRKAMVRAGRAGNN